MSFLEEVINTSLKVPGVKIKRDEYLRNEFSVYYDESIVKNIIESNPSRVGVSTELINKIAKRSINYHLKFSTVSSFVAGLPGGIAMLGTIPADMAQFYGNTIIIVQKLAYLYG